LICSFLPSIVPKLEQSLVNFLSKVICEEGIKITEKLNEGLSEHQTSKQFESQLNILRVLSYDEDWHRFGELQEKTKLSTKTLSKQLDKLKEIKLIEKDENKTQEQ
jgi:DNA-binding MarR family transcriptional regulator